MSLRFPFWQYFEIYRDRPYGFLLDSAKQSGGLGTFSFTGADPSVVLQAKRTGSTGVRNAVIQVMRAPDAASNAPLHQTYLGDPFVAIRTLLNELSPTHDVPRSPEVPLTCGAVGYFGYETGYLIEDLPDLGRDDLALPDIQFGFFDCILSIDHAKGEAFVSTLGRARTSREARRRAQARLMACVKELRTFESPALRRAAAGVDTTPARDLPIKAHFDRRRYAEAVRTCKDHIYRGDVFEICLTHRLQTPYPGDPWILYRALRSITPAPFSACLNLPGAGILSSSPERFVKVEADGHVESRPIKGTRPRGANTREDRALREQLATSLKDRAENLMIVDLVRNDLGRVCAFGTVEVPELLRVEEYATVFQLVSTVRGRLRDEKDGLDLVRAAFPGGSMTGAPKIEAMKIIDRLEPVKRGIYSGAIGYLDYSGTIDLNIVIRTLVLAGNQCYFNVGGAIVSDSDPVEEYEETMDKAYALKRAVAAALGASK